MNTMTNYDSIDKALNTSSAIDVTPSSKPQKVESTKDDVKKDYDYTRANLYSLVEKGQEALNGILEVAGEGGSARAYEVAGQIIKSVADTTDKLMELQKKVNDFLYVEFKEFQSAVTPGQFIAIYQKNQLIASGVIL